MIFFINFMGHIVSISCLELDRLMDLWIFKLLLRKLLELFKTNMELPSTGSEAYNFGKIWPTLISSAIDFFRILIA